MSPHTLSELPWWHWLKRAGLALFLLLVAYLLSLMARQIAWADVISTLTHYPTHVVLTAAGLAAASLLLYSSFDLLGRRYTGHRLGADQVMTVTFICYVFNLNLGSLIGGIAFRYRLYTRLGLNYGVITRIISLSLLTNWLGYVLIAGLMFCINPLELPANWRINTAGLHGVGAVLLALGATYLLLCARSKRRTYCLRGQQLSLPNFGLACLQAVMGMSNWLIMSTCIFMLMPASVSLIDVATTMLLAVVAGFVTHVPGNLGVLEAVFVVTLSHQAPAHQLLAALVAYRLIYYWVPLVAAATVYLRTEAKANLVVPLK
jgi:uncharacterized membrane protein YbhN (UPF0104 family)